MIQTAARLSTRDSGIRTAMDALAERYGLSEEAVQRLYELLRLIRRDPHAPTTLREPGKAINDHVADSLVALELDEVRSASALADLGSGAGFPGLPLAIALPQAAVTLIESAARKCAFMERCVAGCGIDNAQVAHTRAEAWTDGSQRFDLVAARAVAPLSVVAEYAAPLLRVGGTLVVWRGRRDHGAETAAARAAVELGLESRDPLPVRPRPGARHRHLHLMLKVSDTPTRFPRRPGVALKRPLGR